MMAGDGHVEADSPQLHAAAEAFGEYCVMAIQLIEERRDDPKDDLISILTSAFDEGTLTKDFKALQGVSEETKALMELEGERLQDDELLAFLTVLLVAGNETTRNAITGGMIALSKNPAQKQLMLDNLWNDEFMDKAVDEIVRYVTPVLGFIRTVTEDHTYRNTDLKEGDRVLMLYASANRDDSRLRRARHLRPDPRDQPAPRLRHRPALLPRGEPGPHGDQDGVPGAVEPSPQHRGAPGRRVRSRRVLAGARPAGRPRRAGRLSGRTLTRAATSRAGDCDPGQTHPMTNGEPRGNQREHILDTALRLMSAHGSTGMSMRQLASACGVQVAAIYHYFPSKQALLAAVVAERQYGSRLSDPLPIDPSASPSDRLRDLFVAVWEGAIEEEAVWRLLLGESLRGEAAVQPVGQALLDLLGPATTDWVKRCVPEVIDAEAVGHMLIGQLFTGFIRMMFDPELDRATIAREGADVLARGVALPD